MRSNNVVAMMSIVLLAGCQSHPSPVPVPDDSPAAIGALAGTWDGTYAGSDGRQAGRITLAMRVAADSAYGEVFMEQPAGRRVLRPDDEPSFHVRHASSPGLLAVKFVAAPGSEISGALEPYIPQDCDCTVTTLFTVRVRGDTLRGTFETRGESIRSRTGTWWASRKMVIVSDDPATPPPRR